jgi:hypothetical protein
MRIEPGMIFKEKDTSMHIAPAPSRIFVQIRDPSKTHAPIFYVIDHIDHRKKEVYFNVFYSEFRTDFEHKRAAYHSIRKSILSGDWISGVEEEFTAMRAKHLLTYG